MAEKKPRANSRRAPAKKSSKRVTTKKSTVAKKSVAKKSVKKARKKTTKKPSVKRTAKKVTKKAQKKTPTKRVRKSTSQKDTVSIGTSHDTSVENESITIFSRVKTDHAVMLVARVLGLAFVFMGAASTVLGLGRLYDIDGVAALTVVATDSMLATSHFHCDPMIDPQCDDAYSNTTNTTHTSPSGTTNTQPSTDTTPPSSYVDPEPPVTIDLPNNEVSDVADIIVTVADADRVYLRARDRDTSSQLDLGPAVTQDGTIWKYRWDVTQAVEGDYRIITHITNRYGAYHEVSSDYIEIAFSNTNNTDTSVSTDETTQTAPLDTQTTDITTPTTTSSSLNEEDFDILIKDEIFPIEDQLVDEAFDYEDPAVIVEVGSENPLSSRVFVDIYVSGVQFAEVYVKQNDSLRDFFLGLGRQVDQDTWRFAWDTTRTPNGSYALFTKHRSAEGYFFSDPIDVEVTNDPLVSDEPAEVTYIETIDTTSTIVPSPIDVFFENSDFESDDPDQVVDSETASTTNTNLSDELIERVTYDDPDDVLKETTDDLLGEYKDSISEEINTYTTAIRTGDLEEQKRSKRRLDLIGENIVSYATDEAFEINMDAVRVRIEKRLEALTDDVHVTEEIIKERVGDAVTKDSDNDGIVDYDEVTLYGTDPFVADSDNDGFTDGAEIAGGFNPKDDSQEATIMYESPKEIGVIREDILAVEAVISAPAQDEKIDSKPEESNIAHAVISGRGLPNSFVTLYIFSTPIIITVKTEDDGSWNYRFDKELEDGEHQVFVGVTDNAGKIIAKSQPFTFVKEAQAFSPVDAEGAAANFVSPENTEPSLLSQNSLLVALGAVVMALGFILLLLSTFLRREEGQEATIQPELSHA